MKKKFWIVNKINPTSAEILVYGYISPYDISSADFIIELSQLCTLYTDIKIRINSGGGSVFEGIAMYNAIRQKIKEGKNITTCIDGIAASMAGVLALAGKTIAISKYGRIMIHRATGSGYGDAEDLRQQADLIESAEGDCIKIIAGRTGMTEAAVKEQFMQKGVDNWIKADKCIEYKLADEVYDADPVPVPENVTDEKELCNIFETCLNKTSITKTDNMKEIALALGLPENATEAQILAAIQKQKDDAKAASDAAAIANKAKAKALVDNAISNKQLTEADREEYETMAVNNYDFTMKAINKIAPVKKVTEQLNNKDKKTSTETTEEATEWEALAKKGPEAVAKMKAENFSEYKQIWEAHFKAPFPEYNI